MATKRTAAAAGNFPAVSEIRVQLHVVEARLNGDGHRDAAEWELMLQAARRLARLIEQARDGERSNESVKAPAAAAPAPVGEWIVRCSVSGGVTGSRESICKSNGAVLRFATEAEARAYADARLRETNGNPYRTADFRYWPDRGVL